LPLVTDRMLVAYRLKNYSTDFMKISEVFLTEASEKFRVWLKPHYHVQKYTECLLQSDTCIGCQSRSNYFAKRYLFTSELIRYILALKPRYTNIAPYLLQSFTVHTVQFISELWAFLNCAILYTHSLKNWIIVKTYLRIQLIMFL